MTPRSLLAPARLAGQPILRSQTDERLVDLVRAGHEPAFEAIVARYRRPLLRYCGGILSGGRAEDAVQQTFVKAYDAIRRDEGELNLRPWLYRIAHNTALNGLRDKGLTHEPLDPQIDGVERPDQALERREGVREVLAAVEALPARQRDAIVLRELEGRSYEEIAGALGVTGGAVRQLLNRARTSVRAAATAITPVGFLLRVPFAPASEELNGRVGELVGGAGASAVAAKVGATVLVTGAVAGGVAGLPALEGGHDSKAKPAASERAIGPGVRDASALSDNHGSRAEPGDDQGRRGRGRDHRARGRGRSNGHGRGSRGERSRGELRRGGGEDRGEVRSAPGGGGGDRSGPGSGDHSGPGRDGSGSDGGHSGSDGGHSGSGDSSGPGPGGTLTFGGNSGPGSGSDGSNSGPGSGDSGSGSGDSGSGSSSGPGDGLPVGSGTGSGSSGPG